MKAPTNPEEFRECAADCERLATKAIDDQGRDVMLSVASRWRAVADEQEAHESRSRSRDCAAPGGYLCDASGIGRDVIAIGASRGGVEALIKIVGTLPASLPAALLIVLHIGSHHVSGLPAILSRSGPLPAMHGDDGARVALGHIYVAPPDHHMTIGADGLIGLNRGLKEHFTRPAVDPLFRSAASAYGPRVVGIVLTGGGRDGTAGLTAIEKCGGLTIVEEPNEASDPGMPSNAIEFDKPTLRLPLGQISRAIARATSCARAET